MQNTWSIGRTWKPREGWSRPVLTGERHTLHQPQGLAHRTATTQCNDDRETASGFPSASHGTTRFPRVHPPVPKPPRCRRRAENLFDRTTDSCGGHGPGETPGPIPNPEAKAWHGDGTAPDRVWESSTPPHYTLRSPDTHTVPGLSHMCPAPGGTCRRPVPQFRDTPPPSASRQWSIRGAMTVR